VGTWPRSSSSTAYSPVCCTSCARAMPACTWTAPTSCPMACGWPTSP
jgi:hypothetical protein